MVDMFGEKSDIECFFFLLQLESDSPLCSLRNWCLSSSGMLAHTLHMQPSALCSIAPLLKVFPAHAGPLYKMLIVHQVFIFSLVCKSFDFDFTNDPLQTPPNLFGHDLTSVGTVDLDG